MDKKLLIKNLNSLFCQLGAKGKRYAEVWLEDADFGGLYRSGKFSLKARSQERIVHYHKELKDIVYFLHDNAPAEYKCILHVLLYNPDDQVHCQQPDSLVYAESACSV